MGTRNSWESIVAVDNYPIEEVLKKFPSER
jgi:hypothetical protein